LSGVLERRPKVGPKRAPSKSVGVVGVPWPDHLSPAAGDYGLSLLLALRSGSGSRNSAATDDRLCLAALGLQGCLSKGRSSDSGRLRCLGAGWLAGRPPGVGGSRLVALVLGLWWLGSSDRLVLVATLFVPSPGTLHALLLLSSGKGHRTALLVVATDSKKGLVRLLEG